MDLKSIYGLGRFIFKDSDLFVSYYYDGVLEIPKEICSEYELNAYLGHLCIENISSKKYLNNVKIILPSGSAKYKPIIYLGGSEQIVTDLRYDGDNIINIPSMKYREKYYITLFMDNKIVDVNDFEIEYNGNGITKFNRKVSNFRKYHAFDRQFWFRTVFVICLFCITGYVFYKDIEYRQIDSELINVLYDNGASGCTPYFYSFKDDYALDHEISKDQEFINAIYHFNRASSLSELEKKARTNGRILLCKPLSEKY